MIPHGVDKFAINTKRPSSVLLTSFKLEFLEMAEYRYLAVGHPQWVDVRDSHHIIFMIEFT